MKIIRWTLYFAVLYRIYRKYRKYGKHRVNKLQKTRKTRFLRDPDATNRFLGVLNAKMTWNDLKWPKMTSKEARKAIFRLE